MQLWPVEHFLPHFFFQISAELEKSEAKSWVFLSKNYWSLLDHDLMASIWEKTISIFAGNLISSRSYFIAVVLSKYIMWKLSERFFFQILS